MDNKIDFSTLDEKLNALTGLDFEVVETQERAAGNTLLEITMSKGFQARLAAHALGVPVADIKELPLKQYSRLCKKVFDFLYINSGDATF